MVRPADAVDLAALQEDPFRPAGELLPHAREIFALVGEVEIARQTLRQAVVRGFVALEVLRHPRQIDGRRERQQQQPEAHGGDRARSARASAVTRRLGGEERQIGAENPLAPRGPRRFVEQRVEPLHLADERADVVLPAGRARGGAEPRAFLRVIDGPHDLVGERGGVALRHDDGVVARREDVEQPVGVGGDDRLPHRERLEAGERRPFPERRKHAEVERRQRRRHVAPEAGEDEPVAQAEL